MHYLIGVNKMVTKANFTNLAIDQALVDFLESNNLEMTEFKSEINPGVVYKMAPADITEIDSENA
jgi:TATA-box binding protein (TBP) (component of TFIID and TFIIIB)